MDSGTLWHLGLFLASVSAAVVSAVFARRAMSADATRRVDELLETVDRLARQARREQMRRVRAATPGVSGGDDSAAPPPELQVPLPLPPTKEELRRQLLKRRH